MKNRVTKEQIEALLNEGFNRTQVANKLQIATCTLRAKLEQVSVPIGSTHFVQEGKEITCECGRVYIKDRKKGHKGTICNSCATRKLETRRKQFVINIVGDTCCKCGYSRCSAVIEYHHVIDKNKELSQMIKGQSEVALEIECKKCIPFCANCHREFHAGLFSYKDIEEKNLKDYQKKLINCKVAE